MLIRIRSKKRPEGSGFWKAFSFLFNSIMSSFCCKNKKFLLNLLLSHTILSFSINKFGWFKDMMIVSYLFPVLEKFKCLSSLNFAIVSFNFKVFRFVIVIMTQSCQLFFCSSRYLSNVSVHSKRQKRLTQHF